MNRDNQLTSPPAAPCPFILLSVVSQVVIQLSDSFHCCLDRRITDFRAHLLYCACSARSRQCFALGDHTLLLERVRRSSGAKLKGLHRRAKRSGRHRPAKFALPQSLTDMSN